jgi:heme/copper-type cytochrome/quinol oxidase subunit 3
LLFLHTLHLATDWVDTAVLAVLVQTEQGFEPRKLVDTEENSFYWRFVWLSWIPVYLLIYWVPRWAS